MQFCSADHHPQIQYLVQRLEQSCPEPEDTSNFVKAIFDFVRDEVSYEWARGGILSAEATLASRRGNCFNKAALLVTLLRAKGISANFALASIPLQCEVFFRMAPDWAWKHFPSQLASHVFVQVSLNEKMIFLDPAIDSALARGMLHFGNSAAMFSFDGNQDAVCSFIHTLKIQTLENIDSLLQKMPSYSGGLLALMESSANFIRKLGPRFTKPEELQKALEIFLLRECPEVVRSTPSLPSHFPGSISARFRFCNPHHHKIQELAANFWTQASSEQEFCIQAFRWVRDNIAYTLQSDWTVPVEHTLAIKQGMCSTKSCLLTSILRAGGLRAGFFVKSLNAKEAFVVPAWIRNHYRSSSVHFLSAVYLENQWILLDHYLDAPLAQSMDDANLVYAPGYKYLVDFDGTHHAVGFPIPSSPSDMALVDSIDSFMTKKSRIPLAVLRCHNICLELLRKMGSMFSNQKQVEQAMEDHLFAFYPKLVTQVMTSKNALKDLSSSNGDCSIGGKTQLRRHLTPPRRNLTPPPTMRMNSVFSRNNR